MGLIIELMLRVEAIAEAVLECWESDKCGIWRPLQ